MVQNRGLVAKQAGPLSDVLVIANVPKPYPGKDEVLVRVRAAAINPIDWKQAIDGFLVQSWPAQLGFDLSGIVEEVGAGITEFAVGDEVFANPAGAGFAEYVALPLSKIYKKPASISFEEAATLGVGVYTAVAAFYHDQGLKLHLPSEAHKFDKPEWVLITGGATSVGVYAIQLAAKSGYKVITTASKKNEEYVKSLGASAVVDYTLPIPTQLSTIQSTTSNSLRYAIDLVDGVETSDLAAAALNPSLNPTLINLSYFGPQEVPEGVTARPMASLMISSGVQEIIVKEVVPLLEKGALQLNRVHHLDGGFEGLKEGLRISSEGKVGGAKLVASL
ncbi:hypothetical protein HK097_009953 [Rhizophlyctis rosea]|uniref:Enoyl reductase (ER) domain-containing protein n=1 Tax=Rhizophlyctis rosea TaxID=64517 RepID=A0AAD5SJ59_9FUNG|nr:hypothetical protein HK097_009953 [Rhizophlyctis rosea]